jgi:hypothetical protein
MANLDFDIQLKKFHLILREIQLFEIGARFKNE